MSLMVVPSIMNIDVAPVSAIVCDVAIVTALRYWGVGAPNRCLAVALMMVKRLAAPAFHIKCLLLESNLTW